MRTAKSFERRSGCPLNASVEMIGDRWSLLIVRDMMLIGARTFQDFLDSYEGIATNILSARLKKLIEDGIIVGIPDPRHGRRLIYRLTSKGIALAPVIVEMVLWASAHEKTGRQPLIRQMKNDRENFLANLKRKWEESF